MPSALLLVFGVALLAANPGQAVVGYRADGFELPLWADRRPVAELESASDADALATLGWRYSIGAGVDQDFERTLDLYRAAADAGHREAMWMLADAQLARLGSRRKPTSESLALLDRAIALGSCEALFVKAAAAGIDRPPDGAAIIRLLKRSSAGGCSAAMAMLMHYHIGGMQWQGPGVTPYSISSNRKEASKWRDKLLALESSSAAKTALDYRTLGMLYAFGWGVVKPVMDWKDWHKLVNPIRAGDYFRRGAAMGDRLAMVELGARASARSGLGNVPGNPSDREFLLRAARMGDFHAMYRIGLAYEGRMWHSALPRHWFPRVALGWYRRAAAKGHAFALQNVHRLEIELKLVSPGAPTGPQGGRN